MNDSAKGKQKLADSLVKAKTESSIKSAATAPASPKKTAKHKRAAKPKTAAKAKKTLKKATSSTQQDNYQKVNRIWPD